MLKYLAPWGWFHGMTVQKEGSWLKRTHTRDRAHIHTCTHKLHNLGEVCQDDVLFYILRVCLGGEDHPE